MKKSCTSGRHSGRLKPNGSFPRVVHCGLCRQDQLNLPIWAVSAREVHSPLSVALKTSHSFIRSSAHSSNSRTGNHTLDVPCASHGVRAQGTAGRWRPTTCSPGLGFRQGDRRGGARVCTGPSRGVATVPKRMTYSDCNHKGIYMSQ